MMQSEKMHPDNDHYDVVIVGGGIVGLSFANELAGSDFSVAVIEHKELKAVADEPDCRVSAINLSALKRFSQTGVIDSPLANRICAFEKMFVWDRTGAGQIEFDCAELGLPELGAIIENNVLQQMLVDSIQSADNVHYFCPREISEIDYRFDDDQGVLSTLVLGADDSMPETRLTATLLVGADGVNSKVREVAAIQRDRQTYHQQGLVCNVAVSEGHQNTAWQCFMPSGPLAFLPLYNGWCSIVWSLDESQAQQQMSLDDEAFMLSLAEASEFRLGEVLDVSKRFLFPLTHGHASEYVKAGLALIGDSAHNIHPLAGQGANLGIADAFALADVIVSARRAGRQWSALHTLNKYQRQRKGANQLMEMSMTGFKQLFGNDNALMSELRNAGLSLVDHLPALKYRIIRQALGESG